MIARMPLFPVRALTFTLAASMAVSLPSARAQVGGFEESTTGNSGNKVPSITPSASGSDASVSSADTTSASGAPNSGQSELISLEYRNAPLAEVIRTLADAANINFTLSSEVEKGSPVTIRLNNVTYEQALKSILETYKFGAAVENGILKIDTLTNLTLLREEKIKEKEAVWKSQPTKRLVWQVNYAKASDLSELLKSMLKSYSVDPRFSVIADKRTNKVIIEGIADALVESKSILENLDRRKQQVLIEARIVEASSELSKTLNVSWGTRFGFDGNRGLANGLLFPNSLTGSLGGAGALGTSAPAPGLSKSPTQFGALQFSVGSINNLINIDAILRAYETESLANVIASPRVVVQDQEKATIREDLSISRNILGAEGKPEARSTVGNLQLVVSPQVTSDNTLELDIQVQRQTPTNSPGDPVQGSIKREATTKLIVSNGETAVIGGLYQTQKFKGQARIPFLGRLPLIGFLFRTNDEQSFRSELMVLITPRILPGGNSRGSARADLPLGTGTEFPATPASAGTSGNNFANGNINNVSNGGSGVSAPSGTPERTASPAGSGASNTRSSNGNSEFGNSNDFGSGNIGAPNNGSAAPVKSANSNQGNLNSGDAGSDSNTDEISNAEIEKLNSGNGGNLGGNSPDNLNNLSGDGL
ncbi:MAG: hypothetical protein RIR26_1275 [Pseudomonadota bacterium]|jgi:type IV pilus assembly protein PilQ